MDPVRSTSMKSATERTLMAGSRTLDAGALDLPVEARLTAGTGGPEGPRRAKFAHWLLEGRGYTWMRLFIDSSMSSLAVATAVVGADAAGVSTDGADSVYLLPLLVVGSLWLRGLYKRRVRLAILDAVGP